MLESPPDVGPEDPAAGDDPIPVAVCDDHEVFRRELVIAIESDPQLVVIGESDVPGNLGPIVAEHPPKVLAVDLSPPVGDPVDGIRRLSEHLPISAVLALVGPDDDPAAALLAGASGAVEKPLLLTKAPEVIHTIAHNGIFLDAAAAASLRRYSEEPANAVNLTEGPRRLLQALEEGRTMQEIAFQAGVSREVVNQRIWEVLLTLKGTALEIPPVPILRPITASET